MDHLNVMFGPDVDPAPWDSDKKYTPDSIEVRGHRHGEELPWLHSWQYAGRDDRTVIRGI